MKTFRSPRLARGLTLIELMVSLTIGSLLIVGAVTVYSQSRNTYRINDTVARLQENARYAFSVIEPDVQLAGYYGFANTAKSFDLIKGGSTASGVPTSKLTASYANQPIGGTVGNCGTNFVVNLRSPVESGPDDNKYFGCPPAPAPDSIVPPGSIAAVVGADSFTVRHAAVTPTNAVAGNVQLLSSRLGNGNILYDGTLPVGTVLKAKMIEVRDLTVRTYYVASNTEQPFRQNVPALRVKSLVAGPMFIDNELVSGVEDMQVQYGISPLKDINGDGVGDESLSTAVAYVSTPVNANFQVVSVRIWLLMRAEQPEVGFKDDNRYDYAGKSVGPRNDGYRRVLVSRTIQLRNSRIT